MKEIPTKRRKEYTAKFPQSLAKRPSATPKFRAGFSVLKKTRTR
jgi:hypothetical protein